MVKFANGPHAWLMYTCTLAQICISIVLLIIIKQRLWETDLFTWQFWSSVTPGQFECMMTYNTVNVCAYMYCVQAVSMIISILCFFTSLAGKRVWRGLEALMLGFGVAWWTGAAVTCTVYGVRSDHRDVPEQPVRTAVWALSWAQLGLFLIALAATLIECFRRPRKPRPWLQQTESHYTRGATDESQAAAVFLQEKQPGNSSAAAALLPPPEPAKV